MPTHPGGSVAPSALFCVRHRWFSSAQPGSFISVVAVVSDHDLTWAPHVGKTQPVQTELDADGTPFPLIKRVWMVELLDNCP